MIIFYNIICSKYYIFLVHFLYHFLCSPSQLIECLFGLYLCFHKDDVVFCPKPQSKEIFTFKKLKFKKMWNTFFFWMNYSDQLIAHQDKSNVSVLDLRVSIFLRTGQQSPETLNTHWICLKGEVDPKGKIQPENQMKLRSPQNVSGAWQKNSVAAFLLNIWSRRGLK